MLSVGRRLTNSRTRQLEESWCVMYPHLTDTFFHPSLLAVAFVDKSERVAMASFTTVQLNYFPKKSDSSS